MSSPSWFGVDRRGELLAVCLCAGAAIFAVGGVGVIVWQCKVHRRRRDLEMQLLRNDVSDLRADLDAVRVILHRDATPLTASSHDSRLAHSTLRRDSSDDGVDVGGTRHPAKRAHHKAGGKRTTGVLLAPQSNEPRRGSSLASTMLSDDEYVDAKEQWSPSIVSTHPFINTTVTFDDHECEGDKDAAVGGGTMNFEKIDHFLEQCNGNVAYDELITLYNGKQHNDPGVLWRLAKSCYLQANNFERKNPKKRELLLQGRGYANEGYNVAPKDPLVLKWAAVMTGSATEYLGTKEKIEQGYTFKKYLDQALELTPTDYSLLHMRGRYAYSVANLSWLERKAASAFFAAPPTATIDEALSDFLEVEKLRPNQWIENLLYVGRCQLAKGQKTEALRSLQSAIEIEAADDADADCKAEAVALIAKHRSR